MLNPLRIDFCDWRKFGINLWYFFFCEQTIFLPSFTGKYIFFPPLTCNILYHISRFHIDLIFFLFLYHTALYGYTTVYSFVCQSMDIWVVSTLGYKFLRGHTFSFPLSIYLGVKLLGRMVTVLNSLRTCQMVFQGACTILHSFQPCRSIPHQHALLSFWL